VIRFQHKFSSQNLCKTPWHELSLIVQECFWRSAQRLFEKELYKVVGKISVNLP
jgi:hypothetical protein